MTYIIILIRYVLLITLTLEIYHIYCQITAKQTFYLFLKAKTKTSLGLSLSYKGRGGSSKGEWRREEHAKTNVAHLQLQMCKFACVRDTEMSELGGTVTHMTHKLISALLDRSDGSTRTVAEL